MKSKLLIFHMTKAKVDGKDRYQINTELFDPHEYCSSWARDGGKKRYITRAFPIEEGLAEHSDMLARIINYTKESAEATHFSLKNLLEKGYIMGGPLSSVIQPI